MMKTLKIIALLFYLSLSIVYAQQANKTEFSRRPEPDPKIQSLKVGDQVPDILISKIIRDNKASAKISDFKDKLLILDFFDTFCGSCIEALPKLDSLQKQFGNKVKILPVSYQSKAVMETFFNTNKFVTGKNVKLPCVVEDKILGSYFKYKLISHEVWIYKGVVKAITGTDYVITKNIQSILDDQDVNWPVKNDMVDFNENELIFVQKNMDQYNTKNVFLKYSGIVGQRDGIDPRKGVTTTYDSVSHIYRTSFFNFDIVTAFKALTYLSGISPRNTVLTPSRLVLNVKDKSKYVYDKSYGIRSDWNREHQLCYEFVTAKPMEEKQRLNYVIEDLSLKLGINVQWTKKKMNCLVFTKIRDVNNLDSLNEVRKKTVKGGWQTDISGLKLMFFELEMKYPPIIDESNFKGQMIIGDDTSFEGVRKQLNLYGCDIIQAERETDVMVITEI